MKTTKTYPAIYFSHGSGVVLVLRPEFPFKSQFDRTGPDRFSTVANDSGSINPNNRHLGQLTSDINSNLRLSHDSCGCRPSLLEWPRPISSEIGSVEPQWEWPRAFCWPHHLLLRLQIWHWERKFLRGTAVRGQAVLCEFR